MSILLLGLIQNMALLITLAVVYSVVSGTMRRDDPRSQLLSGLLFGLMGVLVMMTPVTFHPGVMYDGRSIVLTLAGMFGGPIPAAISVLVCGGYRLYLGGAGAWVGTAVVLESAALGVALYALRRRDKQWDQPLRLWLAGLLVHAVMLGLQLLLPGGLGLDALKVLGPIVLLGYPAIFLLTARIFIHDENRHADSKRLAQSESRYRSLFENNLAVMLLVDPEDGAIADANPAAENFYGWSRKDLRRMNVAQINTLPPEEIRTLMRSSLEARHNSFEVRHRLADGSVRDVKLFSAGIQVEERQLLYAIVHDITTLKEAEQALEDERRRMRFVIDGSRLGTWEWNVQTNSIVLNETWASLLGYRLEELMPYDYSTWARLVHPDDLKDAEESLDACIEAKNSDYEAEFRMRHKDGHDVWILDRGRVMTYDEKGAPLSMFGTHTDITSFKQAEAVLRDNEERFRALFIDSPVSITIHDIHDGSILDANPAAVAAYGLSSVDELMRYDYWLDPPFSREEALAHIRKTAAEGPRSFEWLSRRESTGEWFWEQVYLTTTHTHGVQRVLAMAVDITKRKQAEEERESMREQLTQAQKLESVGRLAGGVAHDFNNMLSVILGHSELALDGLPEDNPLREDFLQIRQSAERSAALTRQLLAFARKQTVTPRVLDLNDTIDSMLKMLARLIGENVGLQWKPGKDLRPLYMDPVQIDQILANLCVNARDAIGHGTGTISIETAFVSIDEDYCDSHVGCLPGEYNLLSVTDDGCGMDKHTLAHLFEPFYTTKQLGEGTGLGLATVHGIASQNEGFLTVDSEPGRGSTFKVYLPIHVSQKSPATADSESVPFTPATHGHETILIVEDESAILNLAQRILERQGYNVLTASTPGEAIRLAREHSGQIHLLLTDVIMPEMNGRDLSKALLSLYPDLKRIFMSGYTADVIAHQGALDENVNFIQKPFSFRLLTSKVRDALK